MAESVYKAALLAIAALDPEKDSDEGFNEWGQAHCFNMAQDIAKAALAAEAEQQEAGNGNSSAGQ